jgi:hypothetical protein
MAEAVPPGAPNEGPPVVQAPLIILLSPWQGDIDLSTKAGKMLWDEGIRPLETKFSGYGRDLVRFLADIQNRVDKCQWTLIITFGTRNLITNYGEILKTDVQAARDARNVAVITTLAQARTKIDDKQ